MIFELWCSQEENTYTYIPRDEYYAVALKQHKQLWPDLKLIWQYRAKSYFAAMQAYNDFLGYGEYKPQGDWRDIIYDTDER